MSIHSSIIHKHEVESTWLSTGEWINRIWYIYTMEYNSDIKKGGVVLHAMTGMSLKYIVANKRRQTEKATYFMIPFM